MKLGKPRHIYVQGNIQKHTAQIDFSHKSELIFLSPSTYANIA